MTGICAPASNSGHIPHNTYSGEGEISEEIIEPHGIDLPTVIYKDAAEAVDLKKHKPEIRDHLKRIVVFGKSKSALFFPSTETCCRGE